MRTNARFALSLLVCVAAALPTSVSRGGTVVHSDWVPYLPPFTSPSDPSWGYGAPSAHAVFVPFFDDLGGTRTLLSVKLEFEADTQGGSNTFDNESSTGGPVTVAIGVGVKMSGYSGLSTSVDAVSSATGMVTGDTDPFSPDFLSADSFSVTGSFVYQDAPSKTITTGLSPYLGPFDIPFSLEATASTLGTTTGGLLGSNKVDYGDIRFGVFYKVTYTYVATVPEPTTEWLLCTGSGLLIVWCAKRAARRRI